MGANQEQGAPRLNQIIGLLAAYEAKHFGVVDLRSGEPRVELAKKIEALFEDVLEKAWCYDSSAGSDHAARLPLPSLLPSRRPLPPGLGPLVSRLPHRRKLMAKIFKYGAIHLGGTGRSLGSQHQSKPRQRGVCAASSAASWPPAQHRRS